jgi:putative ABC transport system permease protein
LNKSKVEKSVLERLGVRPAKLAFVDLLRQSIAAVKSRPGRSFTTALGTIIGIAAVVTTTGVAATASQQVSSQFDALRSTEVTVQYVGNGLSSASAGDVFTYNDVNRLTDLNGVRHGGIIRSIPSVAVGTRPFGGQGDRNVPLLAANPAALAALHVHVSAGRTYDQFHESQTQMVCLVGRVAAESLGITRIDNRPTVWISGRPVTVIGVVDSVERMQSATLGIFMPVSTAQVLAQDTASQQVVIETAPGAAQVIAKQAPYALRPDRPELLKSLAPPDPKDLKHSVESDIKALFLLMAAISLFIGAVGIANTTLIAVMERVSEIGLRRSLGANRKHIAAQFMLETAIIGTCGGVVGSSLGTITVVVVSAVKDWSPTLDPKIIFLAPFLGTVTGLLAGLQPAWRATRIEPTEALRR